jgi:hypothetical protein
MPRLRFTALVSCCLAFPPACFAVDRDGKTAAAQTSVAFCADDAVDSGETTAAFLGAEADTGIAGWSLEEPAATEDQPAGQGPAAPPATNPPPPSLGDLGFPSEQTQGSAQDQALLDKRSHMLKVHQVLGLITTVPLVATVFSSGLASGRGTSSSGRDLHVALGALTTGLYFTTAYYSVFAPKLPGAKVRGPIRWHKALAWIHGTGMILTPLLGEMAFRQKSRGEKVHGLAAAHGAVGAVTAGAYGLAILSVSFKF